jgi:hypothetical protein
MKEGFNEGGVERKSVDTRVKPAHDGCGSSS